MNGLTQIIAINQQHAAQRQDDARRARGFKPKDAQGRSIRASRDYTTKLCQLITGYPGARCQVS